MTGLETIAHTSPMRVLVFGGTGTAGRGAVRALVAAGHDVSCFARVDARDIPDVKMVRGDVSKGVECRGFDAVVSCMASRTGAPRDAWAIDHRAHSNILRAAQASGVTRFVQLSAICVQKPTLAFQEAKLAFEAELIASGLIYAIVRPTAFFKSLSGQIDRVKDGKPFLVFGDGTLTACKPISDDDLGRYMARCLDDPALQNKVLPIGGPGPAISPLDQAAALSEILGREVKVRRVPVAMLRSIGAVLRGLGRVIPKMAEKGELARIGHYYATESMLFWDASRGRYDAHATPETGEETLFDHYRDLIDGSAQVERGEHSVF